MIGNVVSDISTSSDDNVKWWFSEIDRGIRYRKDHLDTWKLNADFENMNQWSDGKKYRKGGGDEVTVNKIGSYVRTRRAVLGYNNPRAKCIPKTSDGYDEIQVPLIGPDGTSKIDPQTGQVMVKSIQKYRVREELINSIVSAPLFGLTDTMTRFIKAGDMAYGVLKVGFRPTFSTPPKPEGKQELPVVDGKLDLGGFERNKIDGNLVATEDGKELVSREMIPTWEDWFIDWVSYERIIVDPDCENDTSQLRWIVEEEVRPLSDVKADTNFKNTKDLKGTGDDNFGEIRDNRPEMYNDDMIREKHERVRLFHIWDRVNDEYMVLADGYGKWLRNGKTPRGVYEDPYGFYRNNETLGKWYQRANVTDLIPIAMQYNETAQMIMRAAKRSTRKIFMDKRLLDSVNTDVLQSDEDMAIISYDKLALGNRSLTDAMMPFTPPPVSNDLYASLAAIDKDFYEVAGLPPEAVGSPKSETATQANIMNQYHGTRIETDRMCMVGCLKIVFKKLDDSLEANMTKPRAINILGSDGESFTAMVDKEMIVGDFDIDIDVQDMAPSNSGMEGAQWIQASQVVGVSPWMVSTEILAREYCLKFKIKNENYIKALAQAAQANIQMQQQAMMPEAPPPENEADAISQTAAGGQVPRMSQGR